MTPDNTRRTRDERGRWVKGGPSPNPAGAPKRGQSWQETIKRITDMTGAELIAMVGPNTTLGKTLKELPPNLPVKDALVLASIVAYGRDPDPRMFVALTNREEGQPRQAVDVSGSLNVEGVDAMLKKAYGSNPKPQS